MPSTQAGFKKGTASASPADLLAKLGPTVLVDIGLKSAAPAGAPPDLARKGIRALIDTGAGGDCIDDQFARELGLPVTDQGEISGVGGRHDAVVYLARLFVPSMNRLLFQPFTGVRLTEGGQWHRVLLGRSFLRQNRMLYNGATGQVFIGV